MVLNHNPLRPKFWDLVPLGIKQSESLGVFILKIRNWKPNCKMLVLSKYVLLK